MSRPDESLALQSITWERDHRECSTKRKFGGLQARASFQLRLFILHHNRIESWILDTDVAAQANSSCLKPLEKSRKPRDISQSLWRSVSCIASVREPARSFLSPPPKAKTSDSLLSLALFIHSLIRSYLSLSLSFSLVLHPSAKRIHLLLLTSFRSLEICLPSSS